RLQRREAEMTVGGDDAHAVHGRTLRSSRHDTAPNTWHATPCPAETSSRTGVVVRHRGSACGQRGWNRQPGGGASGEGGSPASLIRARPGACTCGTADSSAFVYGCRGAAISVRAGAISTMPPRYITAM